MLYVTTRNKNDVYTANHTTKKDRGQCGGLYVPFSLQAFSSEEINALKNKSFGQCIADVLNLFFSSRLDGLDVDFCVGKNISQFTTLNHRIVVAENWHNSERNFEQTVRKLSARVQGLQISQNEPSNWMQIVVRIAMLFAVYGELLRGGYTDCEKHIDVAVSADDFSAPMAAWYARKMGLPIGNIICGSNHSDSLWELLHQGQLHTNSGVPSDLERLIYATLGAEETAKYCDKATNSRIYDPGEDNYEILRNGMFAAVVSEKRNESVIRNVYRSASYLLSTGAAAAYGGLQDYRASTGEGRTVLLVTEQSPVCDCSAVANAAGITEREILEKYGSV